MTGTSALLAAVVGAPLLAGAFAGTAGPRLVAARLVGRICTAAAGLSLVLSIGLAVIVFRPGGEVATLGGPGSALALAGDRVGVTLLLLVGSVSTVVQAFAGRYLAGDSRANWFSATVGLLTAASAALVTSGTLATFAICWSSAGIALWLLLGTYRQLPAARVGQARTARAFLLGDTALWLAVVLASLEFGTVPLHELEPGRLSGHPATSSVIGCLVVLAALSRSAQLPFANWLPATLAAPTPVSALLHAGVVNAGGVLLIRLAPVVRPSATAVTLAVVAGALTTAYAGALMLTKPDIKGGLAHSTMGQMGFMMMTCGLGLYAAGLFHLIAHGMYKASLFLSSGTQTRRVLRHAAAPPVPRRGRTRAAGALAFAVAVPAATLLGAQYLIATDTRTASTTVLLIFAWASAATALHSWLRRAGGLSATLVFSAVIGVASLAYVWLVHTFGTALRPALPAAGATAGAVGVLLGTAVALAALSMFIRLAGRTRLTDLRESFYVRALAAGQVEPARSGPTTARRRMRVGVPHARFDLAGTGAAS
ncbi:MAG: proton-conducting transporter membrane subunit [Jatrophihabitans sp.]